MKIIFEFPNGLRKHSLVSWIIKIFQQTRTVSFFVGEKSFFGVSCVEPSDSVAGLTVTSFFMFC